MAAYNGPILNPNLEYELAQRLSTAYVGRPDTEKYINEFVQALLGPTGNTSINKDDVDSKLQYLANAGYKGKIYLAVTNDKEGTLSVNLYDIPENA